MECGFCSPGSHRREISLPSMTSRMISKIQRPAESPEGAETLPWGPVDRGIWPDAGGRGLAVFSDPGLLLKTLQSPDT